MASGIFVTGTDTSVGKTFISSLIVKTLRDDGIDAGYFKGIFNGGSLGDCGNVIPDDAIEVKNVTNLDEDYNNMGSYALSNNYSPHLAAHIESVNINLQKIFSDFTKMRDKYEFLIVEGNGGAVCPIKIEGDEIVLLEDIIKDLGLCTILVARSGLGTINHTTLTVKYLKDKGIEVKGIILNEYDDNNIMHKNNKDVIKLLTGINNICTIPAIDISCMPEEKIRELVKFCSTSFS
ncbi:dethiobiotin synthase [Clostridium baratii]|uniref:dethiobiotin synthase n=1 Tax=Clostridium baratii TaxID=1561 RepID=UPI0030CE7414